MNASKMRITSCTPATCLTDLGRPNLTHIGIPESGAADKLSAQLANILVGNPRGNTVVQAFGPLTLVFDQPAVVAVVGTGTTVHIAGHHKPARQPTVVDAGAEVKISASTHDLYVYVAVRGAISTNRLLGSAAPDPLLDFGTWLRPGSTLSYTSNFTGLDHPYTRIPLFTLGTQHFETVERAVTVTPGPDIANFVDAAETLTAGTYIVDPNSNAIGLRLNGPVARRRTHSEMLSKPIPAGAIEITPNGQLVALLRGRPTNVGYPVIAVASARSIDYLGQRRPGDELQFIWRNVTDCQSASTSREAALTLLERQVHVAFDACGMSGLPATA